MTLELTDSQLLKSWADFFQLCNGCCDQKASLTSLLEPKTPSSKPCDDIRCPYLFNILNSAASWGWCHGLNMLQDGHSTLSARLAPFSLLPTPISRQRFNQALELSPIFTRMTANMTLATSWLQTSLTSVGELDPLFTAKLLQIAARVYGDSVNQRNIEEDIRLIIIRSDYMIDQQAQCTKLLQVELNTISIGFGGLVEPVSGLHRVTSSHICGRFLGADRLPPNECGKNLANGFREAHRLYSQRHPVTATDVLGRCALFVVRSYERNEIDQRKLEFELATPGPNGEAPVRVLRMTLDSLALHFEEPADLSGLRRLHYRQEVNGNLVVIDHNKTPKKARLFASDPSGNGYWEVSVIYLRAGYDPSDYEMDSARLWLIREALELSEAVKCPNIFTHLAGVKKIQSLWNNPADLAVCLPAAEDQKKVSATFVDQVDPSEFHKANVIQLIEEAIAEPENFVLKPQREGGLHNIHGDDIATTLRDIINSRPTPGGAEVVAHEGSSFILMRKIRPNVLKSVTLDKPSLANVSNVGTPWNQPRPIVRSCLSELGTFGIHLADGKKEILNVHAGHLLRTKDERNQEGGVATGAAFLDSPLLVDEQVWFSS